MEENRKHILAGNPSKLPGDKWGIAKITNIVHVSQPQDRRKQPTWCFLSPQTCRKKTGLGQPSSWEWRDKFAQRLREYTEGLFWFCPKRSRIAGSFSARLLKNGDWQKTNIQTTGTFRVKSMCAKEDVFEGVYFFTANDAIPVTVGSRPPIHANSITASHYALDSHAVRKREQGRVHLDGFLSYPSAVYYRSLWSNCPPKEVDQPAAPCSGIRFTHRFFDPSDGALLDGHGAGSGYCVRVGH